MKSFSRLDFMFLMIPIISFTGLMFFVEGCKSVDDKQNMKEDIGMLMDSIKSTFVPDRRTQIFDYSISPSGTRIVGRSSNLKGYDEVLHLVKRFPEINVDSFQFVEPLNTAIINVSVGNMRSNPRHSAELASQVLMGQQVTVWDKEGSWYYIQSPDKYLGWIDGGALVFFDSDDLSEYHQEAKVMYMNDFGFCYEHQAREDKVISDLVAGDILRQIDATSSSIHVLLPDGRKGFIPMEEAESLTDIARSAVPDWTHVKETAFKFMGRPYLWGGTSGKGVDCSGFTKMVYYLNGLELPRDASQQVNSGMPIPIDDDLSHLKPGDFLFFGKKGEKGAKDKVTHVAIYIGDGKIIHSSERVQIQSLIPGDPSYAPHRRKTLLVARRMISDDTLANGIYQIKNNPAYGF